MAYGPMEEDELPLVVELISSAFASPLEDVPKWLDTVGHDAIRVLREGGRAVACLMHVPMGHFLLGERVSTVGIAGVAVALEHRGRGAARRIMDESTREIARSGAGLSTLYPATQTLYRAAGYERAGKLLHVRIPAVALGQKREEAVSVRRLEEGDEAAVTELQRCVAREQHGYLDRNDYMWSRARRPGQKPTRGFGFFADGALEGYLHMKNEPAGDRAPHHDVWLTDVVGATARAGRAILGFLHDQRSLVEHVSFRTGPEATLLNLLRENHYDQETSLDWMARITCLEAAVASRGYPEHARAAIDLDVRDPVIEKNAGRWTLSVEGGEARLERGGSGRVVLEVGPLAALYTGYLSPASLRRLGWLDASDADVRILAEIFRSPMPGMCEMF